MDVFSTKNMYHLICNDSTLVVMGGILGLSANNNQTHHFKQKLLPMFLGMAMTYSFSKILDQQVKPTFVGFIGFMALFNINRYVE